MNSEERSAKIAELDQRAVSRLSEVIDQTRDVRDKMTVTALSAMKNRYRLATHLEDVSRDVLGAVRDMRNADRLADWDGESFDSVVFAHLEERGWIAEARLLKELWQAQGEGEDA